MSNDLQQARVEAAVHAAWAKAREFRGVGGQAEFAPPWEFQQVIRAALAAADAVEAEYAKSCTAEIHSWERFRPEQTDSYWIRCKLAGPHDQHEDSDTGLKWEEAGDDVS